MRRVILACCFFSCVFADPIVDFTQTLSEKQEKLLNQFLFALVNSPAGYVLYGDKPMSIERVDLPSIQTLSSLNPREIALMKGRELWQSLELFVFNKEYVLSLFDIEQEAFFICINRQAFLDTVEKNLPLFQYVLGPSVTPKSLLKKLLLAKEQFYNVLKVDQVLLEILMGNGSENAIVHSRLVKLTNPGHWGADEEFPFISKKMAQNWSVSPRKTDLEPSFGFLTLNGEILELNRLSTSTGMLKGFHTCQIPHFSCKPDSEETKSLLSLYKQNRVGLIEVIETQSYFEKTLRKLFTTVTGSVDIPKPPKKIALHIPEEKDETLRMLVRLIHKNIKKESFGAKKFAQAFLKGVYAREKDQDWPSESRQVRSSRLQAIQKELECCKNLERADAYFEKLNRREDLVSLVPKRVFYKTLKGGKGNLATAKTKSVSLQYAFQTLGESQSKDWGVMKKENIGALIPGIAYALIGMQQGEERIVYIHPSYAYGENTLLTPNACLVAQIRLLDFEESEQPALIFPPHKLEKHEYKDLLVKFEVLKSEEFYYDGLQFWDNIKKSNQFFEFQDFQKHFLRDTDDLTSLEENMSPSFLGDLSYLLLSQQ